MPALNQAERKLLDRLKASDKDLAAKVEAALTLEKRVSNGNLTPDANVFGRDLLSVLGDPHSFAYTLNKHRDGTRTVTLTPVAAAPAPKAKK